MQQKFHSTKQVAVILGVHQETILRKIKAGRLEAIKLDPDAKRSDYRISDEALQKYIEQSATTPVEVM